MTNILIYDIEATEIEKLAEEHDTTVAEIVEAMVECFYDNNGKEYV
jgi:hypothetical protein